MNTKGKKEVIVPFGLVVFVILILLVLMISMLTASAESNEKGSIEHCTAAGFPEEYCRNI